MSSECTLVHGRWQDHLDVLRRADAVLTDPPYGIACRSGSKRLATTARSIAGDADTSERDEFLALWGERPALVFGSWKRPYPARTHTKLIWDTGGALGMGDLSVPWKPSHQEIYVLGHGFTGPRTTDVIACPPVQSTSGGGRVHPHEKPVRLLVELLKKCPRHWVIADPFCGSGSTGVACAATGHDFVGTEGDEGHHAVAVRRNAEARAQAELFPGVG